MRAAVGLAIPVCMLTLSACSTPQTTATDAHERVEWFSDTAERSGLRFRHVNGMTGNHTMTEILGSGVALIDYDNDGDLDVFLVQSRGRSQLFRNNLIETGTLSFTDVTDASGIATTGYGMGVATGDFDNDGFVDLYVTSYGTSQLFHNNGDGTFSDVSKRSGTGVSGWSVPAAFFDYDGDGWPDLFVGTYLRYNVEQNTRCFGPSGAVDYCTPNTYRPQPSRLFHNNRDGTFSDVTAKSGIGSEYGPALGVSTADVNGDGWPDLFVANDSQPNQLWINQHDGTFKNVALAAGVALTAEGKAEASMGVDAGDADNDGDDDLFITEQNGEGHNLYVNDGTGMFEDQSARSGLASASLAFTGFGVAWFDFDNDGWLDLLTVNGAVQTIQSLAQAHDPLPLHQQKQLFRNLGHLRFEDVSAKAGAVFALSEVGRGAAFGDIDNDGDTDVVVNNNNGPARLLINNIGNKKHWIGFRLVRSVRLQADSGPAKAGHYVRYELARIEVIRRNSPTLWRRARTDGSYASANDPRVLVGLGDSSATPVVRVHWPDGRTTDVKDVAIDRYLTVEEPAR
jgi:enediyne biosynthesis protein E4